MVDKFKVPLCELVQFNVKWKAPDRYLSAMTVFFLKSVVTPDSIQERLSYSTLAVGVFVYNFA